jgi:sulfite reductase (ferredoxin)
VLLGGGVLGNGDGRFADKVIKIPAKRGPQALRFILDDFQNHRINGESFLNYYDRHGEKYFYDILVPLSDTDDLVESDFVDWGNADNYVQEIGVGECAGVVIDLVQTLILEAKEKLDLAKDAFEDQKWSDAIYHTYAAFVNGAKALLLSENVSTNSQANIISQFDETFIATKKIELNSSFSELVYQINKNKPTKAFASQYAEQSVSFFEAIEAYRTEDLVNAK